MTILAQRKSLRSESSSPSQVDAKPVSAPLIPPRHLSGGVTEVLLNVALVDFSARGKACPQGMAGKQRKTLLLGQVAPNASVQYGLLDQPRDMLVGKPCIKGFRTISGRADEQRPKTDLGKVQPLF